MSKHEFGFDLSKPLVTWSKGTNRWIVSPPVKGGTVPNILHYRYGAMSFDTWREAMDYVISQG